MACGIIKRLFHTNISTAIPHIHPNENDASGIRHTWCCKKMAWGIIPLGIYLFEFFYFLNLRLPEVGHDFEFTLRWLLEGRWHFFHQGLAPFRYSALSCGGDVMYGNPHDMYYSIAQMMALWMRPWYAINISILLAIIAGYCGWYLVGRDVFRLGREWAHVLALSIISNGFLIMHVTVGHFTYHTFTLIGILYWLLFNKNEDRSSSRLIKAFTFAFVTGVMLYSGGWTGLFFAMIGFTLVIPLDLLLANDTIARIRCLFRRCVVFGASALAICASKLIAVYSVMQAFPRQTPLDVLNPVMGTPSFIARVFWEIPHDIAIYANTPFEIHEKAIALSPIILLGLAIGVLSLRFTKNFRNWRTYACIAYVLFLIICMIQFTQGYGLLIQLVHVLPVFSSQHVASRYLYIFSLIVSVIGVWCLAFFTKEWAQKYIKLAAGCCMVITLTWFFFLHRPMIDSLRLGVDRNAHEQQMEQFMTSLTMPITNVVAGNGSLMGETGRSCLNPLLQSADNPQNTLHEGSVRNVTDGTFNLMNPACYQYPGENQCKPGDHIRVSDEENFQNFIIGKTVTWKLSQAQIISDKLSIGMLSLMVIFALNFSRVWVQSLWKSMKIKMINRESDSSFPVFSPLGSDTASFQNQTDKLLEPSIDQMPLFS